MEILLPENPQIICNPRARNLVIRVVAESPYVRITVPTNIKPKDALSFYHSKQSWVKARLREIAKTTPQVPISHLPIWGDLIRVESTKVVREQTRIVDGVLYVGGEHPHNTRRISEFLARLLNQFLVAEIATMTSKLGVNAKSIRIKKMQSRFGSCTSDAVLAFSWYLIFAPQQVVRYVVAHEVAHIKEMNHSLSFWRLVATLCPTYNQDRLWLKQNGRHLFGYFSKLT